MKNDVMGRCKTMPGNLPSKSGHELLNDVVSYTQAITMKKQCLTMKKQLFCFY
jgi:hypothetical protein